ncbi:phosphogluconate dehydrogenase C-terminal domain-containing protein [Propionivibrio dicarboxylicus]|uniref:Acetohydroxy acid isomeroreductase, NADPH-binding domain n=1 Tax=Propionivibrio dicarboxylicus TaxID=83767 RepID=A0A1G8KSX5_9RHOO|nr:phosphogluconate dehydrogenase C-terminal domain-containing protein [Propionivibrio dicarboxylicus]SDI46443.1 Acetohydroxy acid isomeroreductase, NADPH-binding domain [Propionivibrio dicarboxylicus]
MSGKIVVSVIGAGGKMGTRVTNNLAKHPEAVELLFCENSEAGIAAIKARGFSTVSAETAVPRADIVVLAIPDVLIKKVSVGIVNMMRPGATLIILDPAAAVAKELALRDDCTFVVAHPCHPSWFNDQDTPEARQDFFGGIAGKQDIVMALIQGDDARFDDARKVSEWMFAPVGKSFVMGIRDIAFLEPTLVEILGASTLYAMAETVNEAERRGISRDAAVSFLTGHISILSAVFLGKMGNVQVSDACKVAVGLGNRLVLRDDWKRIWDDDVLDKAIATMLNPEDPKI